MRRNPGVAVMLLLVGIVGCAGAQTPKELVSARQSYERARTSGAPQLAPRDLVEARTALDHAERAFAYDADSPETRALAYVADRAAQRAEAQAGFAAAQRRRAAAIEAYLAAQAELGRRAEQQLALRAAQVARAEAALTAARAQLLAQREQLQEAQQESAEAREARERMAAQNARLQAAIERLGMAASLREEARGTVITLNGSVIFAFGKAQLLPMARERLDEVAEVLRGEEGPPIRIEGHTDSVGTDEANLILSAERAEAVRDYLISRGVAADRIVAAGKGESAPIETNDTPEGRAMNRRVEIIIAREKAEPAQGGPPEAAPQPAPQPAQPEMQPAPALPPAEEAPSPEEASPGEEPGPYEE